MHKNYVGLAIAIATVVWGSAFVAIRAVLPYFSPSDLASVRFAIAAVVLGAVMLPRAQRWALPSGGWVRLWIGGVFGIAIYHLLLNWGMRRVDAASAAFIINTGPLFTALLARWYLHEKLRWAHWAGLGLAFCGVALIAASRGPLRANGMWFLAILVSAFLQSVYFVITRSLSRTMTSLQQTVFALGIAMVSLLPFLPHGVMTFVRAPWTAEAWLVWLGVGPSAVAYFAWAYVLKHLPAGQATLFLFLVPLVSMTMGYAILGETLTWLGLVGGAVCLTGVSLPQVKLGGKDKELPRMNTEGARMDTDL
jgi:drug/metabolite transporter (DMT)-like permease